MEIHISGKTIVEIGPRVEYNQTDDKTTRIVGASLGMTSWFGAKSSHTVCMFFLKRSTDIPVIEYQFLCSIQMIKKVNYVWLHPLVSLLQTP